jgi:hypothetical protein
MEGGDPEEAGLDAGRCRGGSRAGLSSRKVLRYEGGEVEAWGCGGRLMARGFAFGTAWGRAERCWQESLFRPSRLDGEVSIPMPRQRG